MRNDERKLIAISYRRNGVSGAGFYVAVFKWKPPGKKQPRTMCAVAFHNEESESDPFGGRLAVLDTAETAVGNVAFAQGNSWRGHDQFADDMQRWIAEHNAK